MDYQKTLELAFKWIDSHTNSGAGICVTSKKTISYPEVTGYYIPTLLNWKKEDLASQYAKWLVSIQKEDGSWYDSDDKAPYVFDSAQILKGLIAIYRYMPSVEENIIKGCDWILGNVIETGQLTTPDKSSWGRDSFCSEMIHLYCISPLLDAGKLFEREDYIEKSRKIIRYYITHHRERIVNFNMLSHFYAYVMEGLWDVGEIDIVKESMKKMEQEQHTDGMITGLNNVPWTCSTGCFQLALVWYKLGDKERGDKTFGYACALQNESGGWYGSYPTNKIQKYLPGRYRPYYFPDEEISWAVKYFLDAYDWKRKMENLK